MCECVQVRASSEACSCVSVFKLGLVVRPAHV